MAKTAVKKPAKTAVKKPAKPAVKKPAKPASGAAEAVKILEAEQKKGVKGLEARIKALKNI